MVRIGLASTDELYFASGNVELPGRDVHRQPQPGCLQRHQTVPGRAKPVGEDTGLAVIRDAVIAGVADYGGSRGSAREQDVLADYGRFLRSLVDVEALRRCGSRWTPATGWLATPLLRCSATFRG